MVVGWFISYLHIHIISYLYHSQNGTAPYCSLECLSHDDPSALTTTNAFFTPFSDSQKVHDPEDPIIHDQSQLLPKTNWWGNGPDGIRAWTSGIPQGTAAGAPSPDDPIHPLSPSPPRPTLRPPKLLRPRKRPIPPTLCMSTPQSTSLHPSLPMSTLQNPIFPNVLTDDESSGRTSAITESIVSTPSSIKITEPVRYASKPNRFDTLTTQVRSWVDTSMPPPKPTLSLLRSKRHSGRAIGEQNGMDPAIFNVISKTHRSSTLRIRSSPSSSVDDAYDGIWWVSSADVVDRKLQSAQKTDEPPQGRRMLLDRGFRIDRQASTSRGRQASRANA